MTDIYINRILSLENQTISETDLLDSPGVWVVLAEPGGGKTELLKSLAKKLGVVPVRASIFRHQTSTAQVQSLVIDGLDEVAKIDQSAIDQIIIKAKETNAQRVIFASRSSEWEEARSHIIRDCFGITPTIARLQAFNEQEQEKLFQAYLPDESFLDFRTEVERVELSPLLDNPQFLKLFADAFIESGRKFTSKKQVFQDAVDRLAFEANETVNQNTKPSIQEIVTLSEEVFAKLLLSGVVGISAIESLSDSDFPCLKTLSTSEPDKLASILDTRLFKLTNNSNLHEPVHRIVAEYCAAQYLVRRIKDQADRFSLQRCLAIIAPNSVVRDDLRGLLGWMATSGDQTIQIAAIDLDPYAVIANGDPSQLFTSSKRHLLTEISQLAERDPYFRRGDVWRTFSTAGLFTTDLIDELKTQLRCSDEHSQLRGLLLELLEGSEATAELATELRQLMLDPQNDSHIRIRAHINLLTITEHGHRSDFAALLEEGGQDALSLASRLVIELDGDYFTQSTVLELLQQLVELYPKSPHQIDPAIESRYFIKILIRSFNLADTQWFLDHLSDGLACTCGEKDAFSCNCRNGISKIIGSLLDQYFKLSMEPYNAARVWIWMKALNFANGISPDKSIAVKVLQSNDKLRQAIHRIAFEGVNNLDEITEIYSMFSGGRQYHAGLCFRTQDAQTIVDHAFSNNNLRLWKAIWSRHNVNIKEPNELRTHMRSQAKEKPEFMRVWAKLNRDVKRTSKQYRFPSYRYRRRQKKRERIKSEKRNANLQSLRDNHTQIQNGRHWGWLQRFTMHYFHEPDKILEDFDDPQLPEQALRNAIPFLEEYLPSFVDIAHESGSLPIVEVLHAACLAIYRQTGSLTDINKNVLQAVKTNTDIHYSRIEKDESKAFETELNRVLFQSISDIEKFIREYIEPQLVTNDIRSVPVHWLNSKSELEPIRQKLAFEWLMKFPLIREREYAKETLFHICVTHCERSQLNQLTQTRCKEILASPPLKESEIETFEDYRKFWFLRHLFFIDEDNENVWDWLKAKPENILMLEDIAGRGNGNDWPTLSAEKIYNVLSAFIDHWPKVHLPGSWGTGSPKEETAYRFLTEIIWGIGKDDPDKSLPVLKRLLSEQRFADFHHTAKNLRESAFRKQALRDYKAPLPAEIVALLDENCVATVGDLRALLLEKLGELQVWLKGAETDPLETFYQSGKRVNENTATKRIVERLKPQLNALDMSVVIEHHMAQGKRCDITVSKTLSGRESLLVIEVKGQWHPELYTAASAQLFERYSIHPNAEHQGIYLVLWFGGKEKIAEREDQSITTPEQLCERILEKMPRKLQGLVDVFVLDLSR